MKTILVISSFVAGSNVGGGLAMKVLPQLGHEVSLLPTTILGRHPGWGAPGGGAVPFELFSGMADGLVANDIPATCESVITGYFASPEQVTLAAEIIRHFVKGRAPVIVDPILGDEGKGLYVREEVAEAVIEHLLPLADVITPNAWEMLEILRRGANVSGKQVYETSVRDCGKIGVRAPGGVFAGAEELPDVPNGTGDMFTLLLVTELLDGADHPDCDAIIAQLNVQILRSEGRELRASLIEHASALSI